MLSDPKVTGLLSPNSITVGLANTANLAISQGDVNRITRTASGTIGITDAKPAVLTVARSVSSENKGQLTDRVAIRIQSSKSVTISDADATSTAQATLTMSLPRYGFTTDDIKKLVNHLITYISTANVVDANNVEFTLLGDLDRVLKGEA